MDNQLKVKVNGGCLVATASPDPDYPGIDVEFVAEDDKGETMSRPRVLIEKPLDDNKLRALIWQNKDSEDYTDEISFE